MSEVHQVAQDLAYVRSAVHRRECHRPELVGMYVPWALYVVIGYALLDVRPAWASIFFAIAWVPGALATMLVYRRRRARGEILDPAAGRLAALHWGLGVALAIASAIGLALVTGLNGIALGQAIVVMIGLVYFLGGVHFDRRFLALGPIMIAGGLVVGMVRFYPWTILGLVIAAGLIVPSLFAPRQPEADHAEG